MQKCSFYLRKGTVYVITHYFKLPYAEFVDDPMFKIPSLTPREVGEAVIAALDASQEVTELPGDLESSRQLYDFLGVKRWSDVLRTATCAWAERESGRITVIGSGVFGRHTFLADGTTFVAASANAEDVGRAALKGLKVPDIA